MNDRWDDFWRSGRIQDYLGYCGQRARLAGVYTAQGKTDDGCTRDIFSEKNEDRSMEQGRNKFH